MAGKSTIKLLNNMLDDLGDVQLKKFRAELLNRNEDPRVRRGDLEGKDRLDIADVLVSTFTEARAIPVAVELLKGIGCHNEAEKLEADSAASVSSPGSSAGASGASAMVEERHFVDKHRTQLIQKVGLVDPILDELLTHNVINQESYDKIRSRSTTQEKMRDLYSGHLKDSVAKDIFYNILKKTQPTLMETLK